MSQTREPQLMKPGDPAVALVPVFEGRSDILTSDHIFEDTALSSVSIETCTTPTGRPGVRPTGDGAMYAAVQAPFGFGTDRAGQIAPAQLFEGIGHFLVGEASAVGAVRLEDTLGSSPFRAGAQSKEDVAVTGIDLSKLSVATLLRTKKAFRGGFKERGFSLAFPTGGINFMPPINDLSSGAEVNPSILFDALVKAAVAAWRALPDLADEESAQVDRIAGGQRTEHPDGLVEVVFPERVTP